METHIKIVEANLDSPDHQRDIVALTAAFALDVMGKGGRLPPDALERLVPGLRNLPTALIFLAYVKGKAVGIATCFRGFSTFAARPLVNIHDFSILSEHRGQGIGQLLLDGVVRKAVELGCCKVTLEVQEHNTKARRVYEMAGFAQAVYGENSGGSLFYTKPLC